MSRTLYSPRKFRWANFLSASKIFLACGLGEKTFRNGRKDKAVSAQSVSAFVQESQNQIRAIQTKLQRLLDGYLEQDIEREIYREQKAVLLSEKKSLEEKMARIEQKQNDWLEPFQNWIKVASTLSKIARDNNLLQKKVAAKEIFGSNLRLASRAARGEPVFPYKAARSAAESVGKIPESLILEPPLGLEPRTYGLQNRCSTNWAKAANINKFLILNI